MWPLFRCWRGRNRGAVGAAGVGERGCFYSGRALIWFLPRFSALKREAVAIQFSEILYHWGPFLFVGGSVILRNQFNLSKLGAGIHILDKYYDLLAIVSGYPNCDGCICTPGKFPGVLCDVAVGCVGPRISEGDLCIHLLLVVDFAPSCSEVT